MIKFIKALLFCLATAIMAIALLFVPECSGTVSITFTLVLGIYLGLDVAGMIAKTASLPKGEFKELNVHKYILSTVCLVVLIGISVYVKQSSNISTAMTSFISSAMIILACVIAGLEGNKIATNTEGASA